MRHPQRQDPSGFAAGARHVSARAAMVKTGKRFLHLTIIGALLAGTSAVAPAQGHRSHPPIPGQQFYVQCRVEAAGKSTLVEVPLEIPASTAPAEIDQVVELPAPPGALRLTRYLPRAKLEQRVIPDEHPAAQPAVLLAVDGPTQSHRLWLVANDSQRNRLVSLIGTWRYMSVADKEQRNELFRQFEEELTREPTLHVSRSDGSGSHALPARVGAARVFEALACQVRVHKFYPHFAFDRQTREPTNRSDQRLNPAALIEIEREGKKEKRWVFAKFPDFKAQEAQALPYRVTLDCPVAKTSATPDFVLLTVARTAHEVWARHQGDISARPIAIEERVDIAGSRYSFQIARFIRSGRLIEEYRPSEAKDAVAVLRVATTDVSGEPLSVWVELGKQCAIPVEKGRLLVSFGRAQTAPATGQHKATP